MGLVLMLIVELYEKNRDAYFGCVLLNMSFITYVTVDGMIINESSLI